MNVSRLEFSETEECLVQINARNADIGAMVHVDRDGALRAAQASRIRRQKGAPLSPIDGMPIAVKANFAVEGWPWTAGIGAFAARIASQDAECVALLRAAGAVLIGLTNMDEGALGAMTDNPWFGRTHNPSRQGYTAGGSSGGSAAAVAAGFCAAALGTDTIGSIRIPASYSGIFGHKPGRGTVSSAGIVALSPTLDCPGVLAGKASICRAITNLLEGNTEPEAGQIAGTMLAVPDWRGVAALSPDVEEAFASLLERARRSGAAITQLPTDIFPFARLQRLLLMIAEIEGAVIHRQALVDQPEGFSPAFAAMLAWGAGEGVARYSATMQELDAVAASVRAALVGFDAVILPTTPHTAFPFSIAVPRDQAVFTTLASCLGDPATAFPIGRSHADLPISAQVVAKSGRKCLALAEALAI